VKRIRGLSDAYEQLLLILITLLALGISMGLYIHYELTQQQLQASQTEYYVKNEGQILYLIYYCYSGSKSCFLVKNAGDLPIHVKCIRDCQGDKLSYCIICGKNSTITNVLYPGKIYEIIIHCNKHLYYVVLTTYCGNQLTIYL
jgi:hypothetical protein